MVKFDKLYTRLKPLISEQFEGGAVDDGHYGAVRKDHLCCSLVKTSQLVLLVGVAAALPVGASDRLGRGPRASFCDHWCLRLRMKAMMSSASAGFRLKFGISL